MNPFVAKVGERLDNVHSLLQSLVRWSKAQMDGFVPDLQPFEITELVRQTAAQFTQAAGEKGIHIIIRSSETFQVVADKDMIQVIFRNIFSNGIKFGFRNTSVVIEVEATASGKVLIRCINEGVPIDAEQRSKLFSYQIFSTQGTAGERGTGLGLAMSLYFIGLNNGRLYLEDHLDNRTVFTVELPAA
jgi:signal transduction histidine kinase